MDGFQRKLPAHPSKSLQRPQQRFTLVASQEPHLFAGPLGSEREVSGQMTTCPHCQKRVDLRTLSHHGLFESYRTCPACGGTFQVDPKTKKLQLLWLALLFTSLALTIVLYLKGTGWLLPACIIYLLLGAVTYWGNRRLHLVAANPKESR